LEEHRTFVINLVRYVPYQLCPLCHGKDSNCTVCKGEKIIPMYVISQEDKIEKVEIVPKPRKI
jgi:hypothetical protein